MPSPHRINVVVPSRAYILKVQREAKKRKVSIAQLFRDALDIYIKLSDSFESYIQDGIIVKTIPKNKIHGLKISGEKKTIYSQYND